MLLTNIAEWWMVTLESGLEKDLLISPSSSPATNGLESKSGLEHYKNVVRVWKCYVYLSWKKTYFFSYFVHIALLCVFVGRITFTGSAVALHCCKADAKINRKMGNSTPCKIVTPELSSWNFAHVIMSGRLPTMQFFNRYSGNFSSNGRNITTLWLFWLS